VEFSVELWSHCVLTLVDQSSTPSIGMFARELKSASGTHMCRSVAPATIQCWVNWQIGLEYLGTEIPLCLNTPIGYEEFVSCMTSPRLLNLKRDARRLWSLERKNTCFSVPRKEGRLVNKSRIYKFKYRHTCFSVPRKERRLVNKSGTYKFKHLHTCSSVTSKKGRVDNKSGNSQI
jgi:hypothetical protein